MVRSQAIRGYRPLVTDLGGNPTRLLRKVGIDPSALDQVTAFTSFENLIDLLERSARELECPDFGLRLAERQDIGILGTLSVAMLHSDTVGDALDCASKYLYVHNAAIAFTVTRTKNHPAKLEFEVLGGQSSPWAQTAEHGLGLAWRIVTLLSEGRSRLQEVWFPHPAVGSRAAYRACFQAPLTFGADRCGLAITGRDLDLPLGEHNDAIHDLAIRYLAEQLPPSRSSFTVQVRRTVETLLGTGTCGHRQVASALYMHPRTLQRRLRDEGTSFEEIKDDVRRDLAERYLSQPDVPLTQVTALLDYTEQSALGRSCRRWFHTTPRNLRANLSSGEGVSAMAQKADPRMAVL